MKLHAMNGFVGAHMHILRFAAELPSVGGGQCAEFGSGTSSRQMRRAIFRSFFERLFAPTARHHHIDVLTARQVQRHDGVFGNAATLHEQNFEVVRHRQQLAQIVVCVFKNFTKLFSAMAHFHHAHARSAPLTIVPVGHFCRSLLQHLQRHGGGAGRKVVSTLGHEMLCE